jgi:hypothetical protein
MAWEEVNPPEVLLMARCTRCNRVAAKYWDDGPGESRMAGWCRCEPRPVLPSGDELAALVARARRKPPARVPGDARLKIFI